MKSWGEWGQRRNALPFLARSKGDGLGVRSPSSLLSGVGDHRVNAPLKDDES
jgi:hypothetical protein